jgi:hypothetical protein
MTIQLELNDRTCWCEFCDVNIIPNTRYLRLSKKGFKGGYVRINVCLNCIKEMYSIFTKDDFKECDNIKLRVLARAIEKD